MDVLSEVLRVVRLSGAVHFRADFSEPWALLSSPAAALTARLKLPAESAITPFHVMTHGSCWVQSGKLPPVRLESGDIIVLPRGDQHALASDLALKPVPVREIYRQPEHGHIAVMQHGGGGKPAGFICGYLHSDQRFAPLYESLPTILCLRQHDNAVRLETLSEGERQEQIVAQGSEAEWWRSALRHFTSEASTNASGNHAVLSRLAELLFMEVLRWQLRFLAEGRRGWLAGLNDPQVGRALALLHAEPGAQLDGRGAGR